MTARVTASQVMAIISTELTDTVVDVHIGVASRLIDEILAGKGLDDDRLADIELWLAAHFVAVQDQEGGQATWHQVGESQSRYGGVLGEQLRYTRYGMQAITLDTTGTLNGAGRAKISFASFGADNT